MINPETVKAYRKANNLTQLELARRAGVSQAKVRLHWEKNGIPDNRVAESGIIAELKKIQDES